MGLGVPPSQLIPIRSGLAGVNDTLKLMAQLAKTYKANALVRSTAARIVQSCTSRDDMCELAALQNWIRTNIRYTEDVYGVETLQTPEYTIEERYGDCDDQSILMATLLLAVGKPAAYCAVGVDGGPYSHVLPVAILRQHDQILYVPCETTLTNDP